MGNGYTKYTEVLTARVFVFLRETQDSSVCCELFTAESNLLKLDIVQSHNNNENLKEPVAY